MQETCAVILAGGKGTRMKSSKPKVLAEVLFSPMLDWVISSVKKSGIENICVVTGFRSELVEEHLNGKFETVLQSEQLGTGHAVMQAQDFIKNNGGDVLVLNGDSPFMDDTTIKESYKYHKDCGNAVTVITAEIKNPHGYGRIIRDDDGSLNRIVEEKDASENEKQICEINSGAYWFNSSALIMALEKLGNNNASGEYYLTDTIGILISHVLFAGAYKSGNSDVVLGANDRIQLSELNSTARNNIIRKLMEEGVDIPCRDGIIIGPDVKIGSDTTILPNTIITGNTCIGNECIIGPNSRLHDTFVGDGTKLDNVKSTSAEIGSRCDIGPFVQIRPNAKIGDTVHLGNFVEVKNSTVDEGTKVSHLTYVGDSDVGKNVNFGCGVVTVNYDGKNKHRTTIGDHAFIGCNTNLVAPVKVGDYGYTAAGSTITKDVPENALGIGRARQTNLIDWVKRRKPYKNQK